MTNRHGGYVVIWEFHPKKGQEAEFERAYGPNGEWAKFFSSGKGYIKTELQRDLEQPNRYLTIDEWSSREFYEAFKNQWHEEYRRLDIKCELLTESERQLGTFERIGD